MEIATMYARRDGNPGRMKTNSRFAWKVRKYAEEVQYENRYTQESSVYALSQCIALARHEHLDTGATSQRAATLGTGLWSA
jgi:hypothetical protein